MSLRQFFLVRRSDGKYLVGHDWTDNKDDAGRFERREHAESLAERRCPDFSYSITSILDYA